MRSTTKQAEPLVLAIETATRTGSVAVTRGAEVRATRVGDATISHSANLIEMIDSVLTEGRSKLSDIDLFAAAVGPGSFTGLRIGLATVKAFAAVTGRRIVGVSTLAAIARAENRAGEIVSLLPAGRGEVFAQMFSVDDGEVIAIDNAAHLTPKDALTRYAEKSGVHWSGEGVEKIDEYLQSRGEAQLTIASMAQTISPITRANGPAPLAASVAALALKLFREGKSVTAGELHAVYVRASDAEINERWQQQKAQAQAKD